MSICVECGEFELFYVLACGDTAVGESNVLLYAGEELTALNQEIRDMDAAFGALDRAKVEGDPETVIEAQDHLAKMLEGYVKPTERLPDKHLVQAYSIRGKKWTRIRSDKMRNHWRSYKIDKSLLQAQTGAAGTSELDRGKLRQAFTSVRDKIKSDLSDGITYKQQIAKGEASGSITDVWDANWLKWVDAVNDSLSYSASGAHFDLSAGAQLMRGYAGFGVQLGYDPKKGAYSLKGNAEARAILGEAKATFNGYFVDRDGWHALIELSEQDASEAGTQARLDFGYFRFNATVSANAMLGASVYATAGLEFKTEPAGKVLVKPSAADSKGEVAAGLFAGLEAGGSVKGAFEWYNPGLVEAGGVVESPKWAAFVSVGATVAVNAGAGLEGVLKITYENGKFMFRCEARAVLGVGAKGGLLGEVNFVKILEFIKYIYCQLKDNDFAFLRFVAEDAWQALVQVTISLITEGSIALEAALEPIRSANAAEDFARKVKARPTALIFAAPEAKGAILYKLSERYLFSFEEHQEAAILTVVGTMQSQREWAQVVERITVTGMKSSAAAGYARLRAVLDGGSARKFETLVQAINSLPTNTMLAGEPVHVRNVA
ncbi:MAG: hypothetical protein EP336_00895 [Rhodobacteraceae bacterium]|nr:MAG: hypothetical protein EP336_00895 [Paracoccaceae bacterium]